jgi:hypothetical protein
MRNSPSLAHWLSGLGHDAVHASGSEPSLILFRGGNWSDGDVIKRMAQLLAAYPPDDLSTCILVVDRKHLRRRLLPALARKH